MGDVVPDNHLLERLTVRAAVPRSPYTAGAGGSADMLPGPGEVATDPDHTPGADEDVLHAESDDDGPPSDDGGRAWRRPRWRPGRRSFEQPNGAWWYAIGHTSGGCASGGTGGTP